MDNVIRFSDWWTRRPAASNRRRFCRWQVFLISASTCPGAPLHVQFQGELRPEQKRAARAMLDRETGVLSATTAFGKTVVAAWLIAKNAANMVGEVVNLSRHQELAR